MGGWGESSGCRAGVNSCVHICIHSYKLVCTCLYTLIQEVIYENIQFWDILTLVYTNTHTQHLHTHSSLPSASLSDSLFMYRVCVCVCSATHLTPHTRPHTPTSHAQATPTEIADRLRRLIYNSQKDRSQRVVVNRTKSNAFVVKT